MGMFNLYDEGKYRHGMQLKEVLMSYMGNTANKLLGDESYHRAIFEESPLPMMIHDITSQAFLGVNKAALEKYGYSREEFLKITINDIHPIREQGESIPELRRPDGLPVVHKHKLKNGKLIPVATTSHELDYDGHKAVFTVIHDLNEESNGEAHIDEIKMTSRDFVEAMHMGFYRTTPNGFFLEVNSCLAGMLGYSRDELIAMGVPKEFSFDHDDFQEGELGLAFPSKPETYYLRKKDGSQVVIDDFSRYVQDEDGQVIYREGICQCIESNAAERKAELYNEQQSYTLIDHLPVAVLIHGNWQIIYANPAASRLVAASYVNQIRGKFLTNFIHSDSCSAAMEHIKSVSDGSRRPHEADLKFVRMDGAVLNVKVTSVAITYLGRNVIQSTFLDVSEQKRLEEKLRLQNVALNAVANSIVVTDPKGKIEWVNPSFEKLSGYPASQAVGVRIGKLLKSGKQSESFYKDMWDTVLSGKKWNGQLINRRKDGTFYNENMTITPIQNDDGKICNFIAVKEDLTEQKSLEEELSQAQKLDVIGRLAGGVAHDYNNVLGVILGYGELIKNKFRDDESVRHQLDAIIAAAKRGANLTKRLLSLAHKEAVSPKVVNANSSIESIKEMLQQIVGENRDLIFNLEKDPWNIEIDPTQLDEVFINLATNARDAIEDIGSITIGTSNFIADEEFVRDHNEFVKGEYLRISFADSGRGIEKEELKKIFEPFFTTKSDGRGTGLGLAMVQAIVKQNRGIIKAKSARGVGTTFYIYFPHASGKPEKINEQIPIGILNCNATVLVVEDRADLLESAKKGLEQYGYKVLTALNPQEALTLCENFSADIDLLLADVVMPSMNGSELSRKIRKLKPKTKTLFMSGYTADVLAPRGTVGKSVAFIQKPFTPQALAKKLQEVLGKT